MNRPETPKPHEPKEPAQKISQDYLNQLADISNLTQDEMIEIYHSFNHIF